MLVRGTKVERIGCTKHGTNHFFCCFPLYFSRVNLALNAKIRKESQSTPESSTVYSPSGLPKYFFWS